MVEGLFFIIPVVSIVIGLRIYQGKQYKKTAYHQVTKNSYSSIKYDRGKFGEYLIYKKLQHLEKDGAKFLFNLYIPKTNYGTSEIDVLLLCQKGLFVFESKNYSGWIFGNELHKNWTQTFPRGKGRSHKESFYNPIMQNALHIESLKHLIGQNLPMRSIIVFSDSCTFKKITTTSDYVSITNHKYVSRLISQIFDQTQADLLTGAEINDIYNKLYPYTQTDLQVRERHLQNLQRYKG